MKKLFNQFPVIVFFGWVGFILGGITVVSCLLPDLTKAKTNLAKAQVLASFCSYNENNEVCDD